MAGKVRSASSSSSIRHTLAEKVLHLPNRLKRERTQDSPAKQSSVSGASSSQSAAADPSSSPKEDGATDSAAQEPAKRKKRKLPLWIGSEADKMAPVSPADVEQGLWVSVCSSRVKVDKGAGGLETMLRRPCMLFPQGWKRTPAGHLIRPLHMRPAHPLPTPAALKTPQQAKARKGTEKASKDANSSNKGRRRRRTNPRVPKRAKRVTIDPTRYGAVHVTGAMLMAFDAGERSGQVEGAEEGGMWVCEEQEEGGQKIIKWCFNDALGKTLREEIVRLPNSGSFAEAATDEEEEEMNAAERTQEQNGDDAEDEDGDEDEEEEEEEDSADDADDLEDPHDVEVPTKGWVGQNAMAEETTSAASSSSATAVATVQNGTLARTPSKAAPRASYRTANAYDPGAESDFSEGYDEGYAAPGASGSGSGTGTGTGHDFDAERNKTLGLLGQFFGSDFLEKDQEAERPAVYPALPLQGVENADEEEEESVYGEAGQAEEEEAEAPSAPIATSAPQEPEQQQLISAPAALTPAEQGKKRREALLRPPDTLVSQTQGGNNDRPGFTPIVRFDPAAGGAEEDEDEDEEEEKGEGKGQSTLENGIGREPGTSSGRTEVKITSLKDMFKPQEEGMSFPYIRGLYCSRVCLC